MKPASRERGFSIVELMVAVAIGLVLMLAVTGVLLRNEGRNRDSLAVNDIGQSGAYAAYLLDSAVRSAGTGFGLADDGWFGGSSKVVGCRVNAKKAGATILPRSAAWPAPFAGFPQTIRVAPVIIGKGQSASGSDVIAVMRGNAGAGEAVIQTQGGTLGTPLGLINTLGMSANQVLLLADSGNDCLLLQTGTPAADTVPLTGSGDFHTTTSANRDVDDFTSANDSVVFNLGNAGASGGTPTSPPLFTLYGVGANRTLFALDMLGIEEGGVMPIAEGVVEMRALYGLDTDWDSTIDTWQDPGTGNFTAANLLDGSGAAQSRLSQIVAVRIGLILRTANAERGTVAPASLVLFSDLGATLQQTRTLATADRNYRHRTVEVTVPLRNVLMCCDRP